MKPSLQLRRPLFATLALTLTAWFGGCGDDTTSTSGSGGGGGATSTTAATSGAGISSASASTTTTGGEGGSATSATTSSNGGGGSLPAGSGGGASTGAAGGDDGLGGASGAGGDDGPGGGGAGGDEGSGGNGSGGSGGGSPGSTYQEEVALDEPLFHFRFEEASAPFVSDVGSYTADCSDCETLVPSVHDGLGFGIRLDGTLDAGLPVAPTDIDLRALDGFTLEAWVSPDSMDEATILQWGEGTLGYRFFLSGDGEDLFARLQYGSSILGTRLCQSVAECTSGSFHVVAVFSHTFDSYSVEVWHDGAGIVHGPHALSTPLDPGSGPLPITLAQGATGDTPFDGTLDELGLYAHPLTFERAKAHYDARAR